MTSYYDTANIRTNSKPTIGVILATYNGHRFILQLLESLLNQSVPIDEVIVRDDHSDDGTIQIISSFIKQHALRWKFVVNQKNIGWRQNFYQLLRETTSDFIFLADQDDIWNNNKIEQMQDILLKKPSIDLLTSNVKCFSDDKEHIKQSHDELLNDGSLMQWSFTQIVGDIPRPGWSYAVRGTFVTEFMKCWENNTVESNAHDAMLFSAAVAKGTCFNLNRITGYWRRHTDSATSSKNTSLMISKRNDAVTMLSTDHRKTLNRLIVIRIFLNKNNLITNHKEEQLLDDTISLYQRRISTLQTRSIISALLNTFSQAPLYRGWKDRLKDLYVLLLK